MRIFVLLAGLLFASTAFADPAPPPARFHANPPTGTTGFPHDGSPLVRIERTLWSEIGVGEARPALFQVDGDEHPTTAEVREFDDARWVRIVPTTPMAAGADYLLRIVDPTQAIDALDAVAPPILFTTGRSFVEEEVPPAVFSLSLTEDVCGTAEGCETRRCRFLQATASGEGLGAWTTLRFFPVSADLTDPPSAQHVGFVDAAIGWSELPADEPADAEEICRLAVSEDAYGRTSEVSDPVCAAIEDGGCDASPGPLALLLFAVPPFVRRRATRRP